MKIGIYPGSFNPVHNGHLAIANYLVEYEGFDQIWFLITPQNPFKNSKNLMNPEFRLDLLTRAIVNYDKFVISTLEWGLPQPVYTVNTLNKIRMMRPSDTIELILGSDNWATFHRWKEYQTILKSFKILIYPRRGSDRLQMRYPSARLCKTAPKIEISSTFIRESIAKCKDVRFFMPPGLFDEVVNSGFINPKPLEEKIILEEITSDISEYSTFSDRRKDKDYWESDLY